MGTSATPNPALQRTAPGSTACAVLLAAMLGLGGCYDFESPLDATPQISRDEALVGRWRCLPAKPRPTDQPATMGISPAGDRGYAVTLADDGKPPEHFGGYSSAVSGSTVLNVRDADPDSANRRWRLVRYSFLLPDVVRFELVNEKPFRSVEASPAALRAALERLARQPGVYEDLGICLRIVKDK